MTLQHMLQLQHMLNKTFIENYLDYFLEKLRISSEHLHHSVLTEFVQNPSHKTYRLVVGMHCVYLALREDPESIEDASRKHSGMLCSFCFTSYRFI